MESSSRLEIIKDFLDEHVDLTLDRETAWGAFAMAIATVIVILLTLFVVKDHRIDSYYLTNTSVTNGPEVTCIYASSPWYPDEKVFCTTDIDKAIEVVRQLNETVR